MVQFRYIAALLALSSALPVMGQSGELEMLADYDGPRDPTRLIVLWLHFACHGIAAVFLLRYFFLRLRPAWVGPTAETIKNRPIWLAFILAIVTALAGPTIGISIYFCFSGGKVPGGLLFAIGASLWLWFLFKSPTQKASKADDKPDD